jgi:hypothetical protein
MKTVYILPIRRDMKVFTLQGMSIQHRIKNAILPKSLALNFDSLVVKIMFIL